MIKIINIWEKKIEEELSKIFSISSILEEAMHYSLFPGGRRFRPICVIASFYANAKNKVRLKKEVLICATAVELVHTYSLIHDDLPICDASDYRRGKLACHKKFSPTVALFAGNALLTLAISILGRINNAELARSIINELVETVGHQGMLLGQTLDLTLTKRGSKTSNIKEKTLEYIHLNKTAKLIATSLRIGGILASASRRKLELMEKFGINLGLAFQIEDDLKDADSKEAGINCLEVNPDILYWKNKKNSLLKEAEEMIKSNYPADKCKYFYYLIDVLREDKFSC